MRNWTLRNFFVYIMVNEARTLYIGMTNDLERRAWQHKNGTAPGFTSRYSLTKLVYVETCEDVRDAISREKHLKGWRRSKKLELISAQNPNWEDLAADWYA